MNSPPAKAGGFGLRLKAGLIGSIADACESIDDWLLMLLPTIISAHNPTQGQP